MNARMLAFVPVLLVALILVTAPATALAYRQVFVLPPDTANNASVGFALLSDGSVYGKSGPSADSFGYVHGPYDGTFWGAPAPFFPVINVGTPVGLLKVDMNDSTNLVGEAWAPVPSNNRGFVTENALTTPVTTILNPNAVVLDRSRAVSINNSDVIVGTSYTVDSFSAEILHSGTVWRKSTGYTPEVTYLVGRPQSISENGHIVGWEGSSSGAATKIGNVMGNAIPYTGDIGGLNGVGPTFGQDINDSAQVAGWAFDQATSSGVNTAFFWDPVAGMTGVNHAALGAIESFGRAVNNDGVMVGSLNMGSAGGGAPFHAFCYYQGQAVDLNTLIDPNSGWELYHAYDVNDAGWITGVGTFNGQFRGFRMQHCVPSPASIALACWGIVILAAGRRMWRAE